MGNAEYLASLTGWTGRGDPGIGWAQAEEELGVAIPPDFRELAGRFPAGTFQGYLHLRPHPRSLADMRDRRLAVLRRWRDNTPDPDEIEYMRWVEELAASRGEELPPDEPLQVPFPLWPEPGGIFPWAQGASVPVFFWLRAGQDPRSWPVVWFHGDDPDPLMWEQFDGTATDFLIALVTGQIDVQRLGAPVFPPPPRFDQ